VFEGTLFGEFKGQSSLIEDDYVVVVVVVFFLFCLCHCIKPKPLPSETLRR